MDIRQISIFAGRLQTKKMTNAEETNKRAVLITGASGFVGSFLVEEGLKRGFEVWAGIRRSSSRNYLQDSRIRFIELDFGDPGKLRGQLAEHREKHGDWDCIIHCAGVTKCRNKEDFFRSNYEYTRNFAGMLAEMEMVPAQFVYISTLGLFGPIRETDYLPITDADTPCPNTAYGMSKLKAERYLESLPDFPYVFFRPTGVYGPREKDYFLMAKSIRNHVDFSAGFGRQDLTFIYVKDLARAVFLAIGRKVKRRSYFVTDGKVYSSRSFSRLIQKELGNPAVLHLKCPLFILKAVSLSAEFICSLTGKISTLNGDKYKIMKQRNWQCDISPLADELGFVAEYDLEKGVKETIAWYKQEGWL